MFSCQQSHFTAPAEFVLLMVFNLVWKRKLLVVVSILELGD
jgi:hypothetical protein